MSNLSRMKKTALGGIIQNPVFVLVLGMCPTIKKSTNITDAFFLGVATMFVLIFSNILISSLRKVIPDKVRLPAYIIITAMFVSIVEIFLKSEIVNDAIPGLYNRLGDMISLITVNCIVFARAESFASKNSVLNSLVDGLSMGIGFVMAISLMGGIRQLLVAGGFEIFNTTSGGFMVLGLLMALFNFIYSRVTNFSAKRQHSGLMYTKEAI